MYEPFVKYFLVSYIMSYMSTVSYFSTIQHNIFSTIHDTKYTHKSNYEKVTPWYTLDMKLFPKTKDNTVPTIIYHKKLHNLFFMLIDPLKSRDEMTTEFFILLDKHKDLLREITPHYKKLQRDILNYMSNQGNDSSYTNEKFMCFWTSLLNSRIIFVENKSFKRFEPSCDNAQTTEFIIRMSEDGFEYINRTLSDFLKMSATPLYEKVDTTKLNLKTMDELKILSMRYNIQLPSKLKKAELIQKICEVLI